MFTVDFNELNCNEIAKLFFDEPVVSCNVKNTSHGEADFREALIVQLASGSKFVIKLADNSFTAPDRIRMWQRCAADYRDLGYYTPRILADKSGEFPTVRYKGHDCAVYAEDFAKYTYEDASANGLAASKYFNDILIMTAKVAALHSDYAEYPSGYCLFECFAPDDEEEEVLENAWEWKRYAETLPEEFHLLIEEIWTLWNENREALNRVYHTLPTSIFQADLNSSNTLIDENENFVGVFDFNLCGRDVLLNYTFREIYWYDDEIEIELMRSAVAVMSDFYSFSQVEKDTALMIYRCVKPLWYTKLMRLKKAGNDVSAIRTCLEQTRLALTRDIDFFS